MSIIRPLLCFSGLKVYWVHVKSYKHQLPPLCLNVFMCIINQFCTKFLKQWIWFSPTFSSFWYSIYLWHKRDNNNNINLFNKHYINRIIRITYYPWSKYIQWFWNCWHVTVLKFTRAWMCRSEDHITSLIFFYWSNPKVQYTMITTVWHWVPHSRGKPRIVT